MKKFLTGVLIFLLVLTAVAAAGYAAARQSAVPTVAPESTDDVAARALQTAVTGGAFTVTIGELNALLIERLPSDRYPSVQSAQLAASSEPGVVTIVLVVSDGHRNWAVTVAGTASAEITDGTVSGVRFCPTTVRVGRLPIPAAVWRRVAAKWAAYDAETHTVGIPVTVPVPCTDLTVSADGVTLTVPAPATQIRDALTDLQELWAQSLQKIQNGASWTEIISDWKAQYPAETAQQLIDLLKAWVRARTGA